jgi:hypothetical protein
MCCLKRLPLQDSQVKENISHKLHLYLYLAFALANIAAATLNVKGKCRWL